MTVQAAPAKPSLMSAALTGLRLRCPACGTGALFSSYLKTVEACPHCHESLGHIRADDGPAWLTILIVGHLVAPFVVMIAVSDAMTSVAGMAALLVGIAALTLLLLPRAKGLFVAAIWAADAPDSASASGTHDPD